MTPQFSIVVPMHDNAATIGATLRSALAQDGVSFEVLVIDDGSRDEGAAIVNRIAAADSRVRMLRQPSAGVSAARNAGLRMAAGDLVAFLDADDLWSPDKLLAHAGLHRAVPGLAASYARIVFLPETATSLADGRTLSTIVDGRLRIADAIGENPVCTSSNLVVKRQCLLDCGGFSAGWSHAEDQELVLRLLAAGHDIRGIDRVLTGYRFSRNGLSMDLAAMLGGWGRLADRFLPLEDRPAAEALYLRYLARRALRSGAGALSPARFALAGLRRDARAFLADRKRGWSTLAAAIAAPVLPDPLRRRLFA